MIYLKMQVSFVSEKKAEPDNILQLGEVIINKLGASAGTKVTLALAARIAFLHKIYVDNHDEKGVCDDSFWEHVDKELGNLQKQERRQISMHVTFLLLHFFIAN
ncbi:hypothetical protein J3R30DRAFT_3406770 [Lentinula aciculospora]|uniref:Uncharacterized protein n=1 Tax=Lentinula aciculospora TaxID=153920 RepID=A0A9W9DJX5_9AGAR|nr:hypothetical protein J3R30DRAFT_3406770 [Lentinula aciculospora]